MCSRWPAGATRSSAAGTAPRGRHDIEANPDDRGLLFISPQKLLTIFGAARANGWQITAHCQGGGAVDAFLDALEALNKSKPIAPTRSHLMHASFQSPGHLDITRIGSQDDDSSLRKVTADFDSGLHATHVRHLQVQQRNVRTILFELLDCLDSRRGLRDHLHVRFIVDQPSDAVPQQRVIVRGQNSNQPGIAHRTSFFRKNPNRC